MFGLTWLTNWAVNIAGWLVQWTTFLEIQICQDQIISKWKTFPTTIVPDCAGLLRPQLAWWLSSAK
jgi:hypothetical protein